MTLVIAHCPTAADLSPSQFGLNQDALTKGDPGNLRQWERLALGGSDQRLDRGGMPAVRFSMPASYRHQDEYLQLNDETAATGRRPIVLLDQNQHGASHAGTLLIAAFLHFDLLDVVFGGISGGLSPVFFDTFAFDLLNVVSPAPSTLRLTGNLVAPCPHSVLEAPAFSTASSSARGAGTTPRQADRPVRVIGSAQHGSSAWSQPAGAPGRRYSMSAGLSDSEAI
ncbi:hypothetical protein [Janthinobacterium sp. P210006]|uniref:hypothetical protein n=1 Tax=Janthinobacterium sp. P210006 TaxID=3112939 RepID=UPI002E26B73B|nr:hypothetical protein [Janthinobacterium sp. P210006]